MKATKKIATLFLTAAIAIMFVMGSAAQAQQAKAKPWPVGDKDKTMKAPGKPDPANGKELWAKHCKSCHGSKGLGDGPKAAGLKTFPGDFSAAAFQGSTDGELFFRTSKGRDEMPAYEKKIPEAKDRWDLVGYMRSFKK
ncbi:MAG TPA: cytochrome c [Bacteroidales bacterium]|nr:cytochrome c [Bacteroidales bacterium]